MVIRLHPGPIPGREDILKAYFYRPRKGVAFPSTTRLLYLYPVGLTCARELLRYASTDAVVRLQLTYALANCLGLL